MIRALVLFLSLAAALGAEFFDCPYEKATGYYEDPDQCDKYWSCVRGEAKPLYCEDGLVFDKRREQQAEPCDHEFKVDCSSRPERQESTGTGACERANGYYPHENPLVCDQYYVCVRDRATLAYCTPGLHFDLDKKICDWPASARRGECSALQSLGDFTCPQQQVSINKQIVVHPNFPHESDCQLFYACKNGKVPAISRCDPGLVFNTETSACTDPELVPECADYYSASSSA